MTKALTHEELLLALEALDAKKTYRKKDYFEPYNKQQDFFDKGAFLRERLLMAGNQQGKTYAGAFETACHLTGEYPDWWLGRRFDHAVIAWAAGVSAVLVRDGPQRLLCGTPGVEEHFGTGLIPKESFVGKPSLARGVTDAYDTVQVRHKSGGVSTLTFKSYEQGPAKFQSATLDFLWLDEEPDEKVYGECLARITATNGMLFMTFTPLLGMSTVVRRFIREPSPDRGYTQMSIEDAKHIAPEERKRVIDGYQAHERDARARGIPMLGSGRIFTTNEEAIREGIIEHIPIYWKKAWAIDFGINERHKFAAVLCIWDVDNDVIHVQHAFREANTLIMAHAKKLLNIGGELPVIWPQDGHERDKSSGTPLATLYKKEGLKMLPSHATWEDGGNSTEAAIKEMQERFETGRLKIAGHLSDLWDEYRSYHRKDGKIVKEDDDILSALGKFVMAKRFARPVAIGPAAPRKKSSSDPEIADGVDFDPF